MNLDIDRVIDFFLHKYEFLDRLHVRIQEFSSGGVGGGGPGQYDKKILTTFFFSPQLILQKSMVNFKEFYHFSRFQRGSNIFQGVQLFPGGGGGV